MKHSDAYREARQAFRDQHDAEKEAAAARLTELTGQAFSVHCTYGPVGVLALVESALRRAAADNAVLIEFVR